jgi:multicomponent Na+:H+ antiporter subunit F
MRGSPERRMVGFEMTSVVVTLLLALFTVASNRLVFMDIPLTLAILTLGGGLVFARFLEKHL